MRDGRVAPTVIVCSTSTQRCRKRSDGARDGQALLSFCTQNYHHPPQRFAFIHGHMVAWHQPANFVQWLQQALDSTAPFIHLSAPRVARVFERTGWCLQLWGPLLHRHLGDCPRLLATYQGLQFVADGSLLRRLPLATWARLERIGYGDTTLVEFARKMDGGVNFNRSACAASASRIARCACCTQPNPRGIDSHRLPFAFFSAVGYALEWMAHVLLGQPPLLWDGSRNGTSRTLASCWAPLARGRVPRVLCARRPTVVHDLLVAPTVDRTRSATGPRSNGVERTAQR